MQVELLLVLGLIYDDSYNLKISFEFVAGQGLFLGNRFEYSLCVIIGTWWNNRDRTGCFNIFD